MLLRRGFIRGLAGLAAAPAVALDRPDALAAPTRAKLTSLIHAEADELARVQNATAGMNAVAMGLDLAPGDEVLQTDQEHVGAKSCWELLQKRHGVVWKTVTLPVPANDPEEIVSLVEAATRAAPITHPRRRHPCGSSRCSDCPSACSFWREPHSPRSSRPAGSTAARKCRRWTPGRAGPRSSS